MKVYIHYTEPAAQSLHQTLKITLPKKWESGPAMNLMDTFVKNYNEKHPENELSTETLRLETDMREIVPLQATVSERVADRADLYVKVQEKRTGRCMNFGCNQMYSDGECVHHTKPPVFHETVKYWSCCPHKKAYDWDSFMQIKGCCVGKHSLVKPGTQFLGGNDLRAKLPSAAGYNRFDALKKALVSIGCSEKDFDAAKAALMAKFDNDEDEVKAEFATEFGFGLHNLIGTTGGTQLPASE